MSTITDEQVEAALDAYFAQPAQPDDIKPRIRAALEASERAAWRKIEEASRGEGTCVLAYSETEGGPFIASIYKNSGRWQAPAMPTHFRPLPSPPEPETPAMIKESEG